MEHFRTARKNIVELKLAVPLNNIRTNRFFSREKYIFLDRPFDVDIESEIKKDIKDLKWDEEPFGVKYEPLILLKLSKMFLEDSYRQLNK